MAGITGFEEIEGWKTGRQLTNLIYKLTEQGAFIKDYGLKDQIRRAAVSVMSNIAEGFESRTDTQFIKFLGHAKGSAGEVRSQLYIAFDLKYISQEQFAEAHELADRSSRQITRFMNYLQAHPRDHRFGEEPTDYNFDVGRSTLDQ